MPVEEIMLHHRHAGPLRRPTCASSRCATAELAQRPLPATTTKEVNRDADLHRPRSNGDPTCHSSHPERLRRMPGTRHPVGASSAVPDVRARRLLRLVADATRQEPRPHHRAPHHAIHGARRILALVLCPRELRLSFGVAAAVMSEREVLRGGQGRSSTFNSAPSDSSGSDDRRRKLRRLS
jgi:hypothetical protein